MINTDMTMPIHTDKTHQKKSDKHREILISVPLSSFMNNDQHSRLLPILIAGC